MTQPSSPFALSGKENNRGKSNAKLSSSSSIINDPKKSRRCDDDDDGTPNIMGRRKGTDMNYSSISPSERRQRCPSAKTISHQCFPMESLSAASTSSYSSSESLLVDDKTEMETTTKTKEKEGYILEPTKASPLSRRIMDDVEQIYQSAPIPKSYLSKSQKQSPVITINKIPKSYLEKAASPNLVVHKMGKKKKSMEASELLGEQHGGGSSYGATVRRRRTSLASTNANFSTSESKGKAHDNSTNPKSSTRPSNMPVPLSVQREVRQRKERIKEARNASNSVDGRRNLDKRTVRLRYGEHFKADILQQRQQLPYLNNGTNHNKRDGSLIHDRSQQNGVSIVVRKRPIFDYELDRGDYDVVSIDNTSQSSHDVATIHNTSCHADMKTMLRKDCSFSITAAFDEHSSDDNIYQHVVKPLILDAACDCGVATILLFGQTGAGKSYTMSGIEARIASTIFQTIATNSRQDERLVTIQFVELCGSKDIRDLFVATKKPKQEVKIVDTEDMVVMLNASELEVKTPEELLSRILLAKSRRKTEATDKNGVSSRSHAVCQIQIKNKEDPPNRRCLLTLIDLAGSERRHDSMYHTTIRQKESAEINASLYSLKECIRARSKKNARIPFRSTSLTRLMKESFEKDGAKLCVIACVAPNATDTEHTMETLKTVASIVGMDDQIKEEKPCTVSYSLPTLVGTTKILPPKQYDHERLKKFLANKHASIPNLDTAHDGKSLMKMSVLQMRTLLDISKERAQNIFDLLRKENDRVAALQRKDRVRLKEETKLAIAHRG